jgi:hypothetical protein
MYNSLKPQLVLICRLPFWQLMGVIIFSLFRQFGVTSQNS